MEHELIIAQVHSLCDTSSIWGKPSFRFCQIFKIHPLEVIIYVSNVKYFPQLSMTIILQYLLLWLSSSVPLLGSQIRGSME